jgi:hypothetical protein
MGQQRASKANRAGVAERCAEAAGHQTIAVALARSTSEAALLRALALSSLTTAPHPAANTLSLRPTVPGLGTIRRRVRRYDIQDMDRGPRGQAVASACRLPPWAKASAGQHVGPSGQTSGNAPRQGACAAAVLCVRTTPHGPKYLTRLAQPHAKGTARTLLAQTLARAVYERRKRTTALALDVCLRAAGRSAGNPAVSRDAQGLSLPPCLGTADMDCVIERGAGLWPAALIPGGGVDARSGSWTGDARRHRFPWAAPRPTLALPDERGTCSHPCAEDGLRGPHDCEAAERPAGHCSALARPGDSASSSVWGRHMGGGTSAENARQARRPTLD